MTRYHQGEMKSISRFPKPGKYQHFKGKYYEVLGVAHHSETLEPLVIYRALYDSKEFGDKALWVRPLKMFIEEVEVEGKMVPRFKYIVSP